MDDTDVESASAHNLRSAVAAIATELEALRKLGVLRIVGRNVLSVAELEQLSARYRARRRALRRRVREAARPRFDNGDSLLMALIALRTTGADVMAHMGTRASLRDVVLAEISTFCVAAFYEFSKEWPIEHQDTRVRTM